MNIKRFNYFSLLYITIDVRSCVNMPNKKNKKIVIMIVTIIAVLLLIVLGIILFIVTNSNNTKSNGSVTSDNLSSIKAGYTIKYGKYEQDNNEADGSESIEWKVLDVQDNNALIVSNAVLDCKKYNETEDNVSWSDSELRQWLNSSFYETAFSEDERNNITLSEINNYGTYEGYDEAGNWIISNTKSDLKTVITETSEQKSTQDYVFLLSIDEVNKYLTSEKERKAFLSDYGTEVFIKLGIQQAESYGSVDEKAIRTYYERSEKKYGPGFCNWWLRSSGTLDGCATAVDYEGTPGQSMTVTTNDGGVRPAMWLVIQ